VHEIRLLGEVLRDHVRGEVAGEWREGVGKGKVVGGGERWGVRKVGGMRKGNRPGELGQGKGETPESPGRNWGRTGAGLGEEVGWLWKEGVGRGRWA